VTTAGSSRGKAGGATALALDHLVVAAATLEDGIAWCDATLGHVPSAGGRHAFMGTHNRIFSIASDRFARAYLEIIAIDPAGTAPARPRWFGLDEPALRQALDAGPRLIHWAASCADIDATVAAFRAAGFDPGAVLPAERATPDGILRWKISVRPDGRRLVDGAVPTLLEWGDVHPSSSLPASGCSLQTLAVRGLPESMAALVLNAGVDVEATATAHAARSAPSARASTASQPTDGSAPAPLVAVIATRRGPVSLTSIRLAE
jgi:hypothetical protein